MRYQIKKEIRIWKKEIRIWDSYWHLSKINKTKLYDWKIHAEKDQKKKEKI